MALPKPIAENLSVVNRWTKLNLIYPMLSNNRRPDNCNDNNANRGPNVINHTILQKPGNRGIGGPTYRNLTTLATANDAAIPFTFSRMLSLRQKYLSKVPYAIKSLTEVMCVASSVAPVKPVTMDKFE